MSPPADRSIEQRRQRLRGIAQIAIGVALILIGVGVTASSYELASPGGRFVVMYGPVIGGFVAIGRGVMNLIAGSFMSLVALRYLMARQHRVSRIALIWAAAMLLIGIGGLVLDHVLLTKATSPFDLDEAPQQLAKLITGVKIGGFCGFFLALVIGGLRYMFSFFTTVPIVGVWIGTAALVCVLSVMSGFENDLRDKILGSNAHIQITREDGDITGWREVKARIDRIPGVVASTPFATSEVVLAANSNGMPVIIKGIDPKTVGNVTELVKDLEDPDAMKRLEPLISDPHDLRVQPTPPPSSGHVVDPPPPDMPQGGDPIDFTKPTPEPPSPPDAEPKPSPPGDAADAAEPVTDPPPTDMLATSEPPIDYSAAGSGSIDPAFHVVDIPDDQPALTKRTQALSGVLVGRELVKQTHLYTGEEVRLVSPLSDPSNPDANGTPIPFNRDYRVAGIFFTGMYEYDLKYVYVTLDSLQAFLDRKDAIDGIEVRIGSPDDTDAFVQKLSDELGPEYRVQDWKDLNRSLFSALKLEKVAMFLVLGIVILVASFSIVGNLIMVVIEKAREIALLKTLGATDATIVVVFIFQGLLIGLIGTALGIGTGLLACWAGKHFGIPLNPDVYYIDRMPVHVESGSVMVTAALGVLISLMATVYPAFVAARVRPAAGMRH